jgi:phenylalanyl-tRNA synthetase beta chain
MPTITLNRNVVEKLSGVKLPDAELKERIAMLGTDLEELTKTEINVEIFPNRPDLLSEQGFARALASFAGKKTGLRKYTAKKSSYKMIIDDSVKNVRPYTACAVVKNLKFDEEKIEEIIKIQEKLHVTYGRNRKKVAIGIYPLDKITFPITFKADKPENIVFQPLEARSEMTASEILEKHPTGREYGHLLDGLKTYPFFIDANDEILSLPPVINSNTTGRIDESTKDVFIECSGFDHHVLSKALNMILTALADIGGELYEIEVVNKHTKKTYTMPELEPEEMKISLKYVNARLGLQLQEKDVKKCLEKMGLGYSNGKALIPCYRADILDDVDLVEDIAIGYGFDNFVPEIPNVATVGEENELEKFKEKLRNILVGFGLYETKTYNIASSEMQTTLMRVEPELIMLANSLTKDYDCMRAWIIPSLLQVLKDNKHYEFPQNYFDIGRIFKADAKEETGIKENDRIAVALCGKDVDYTTVKQILDQIFNALDVKYSIAQAEHDSFIPGRVGRVSVMKKNVAYIGELHPEVLNNFEIEMPVSVFELNLTELFELVKDSL